jgi:hypothetical protein
VGKHERGWKRVAAVLAAGALLSGSLPREGRADEPPFAVDLELLADRLFAAKVQLHHGGQPGLERLLLSAEFLEWRRLHAAASAEEATHHLEARRDALTDGLTPPDRMLSEAEFAIRAAAVLVGDVEGTAAGAPHLRRLIEVTLGKAVGAFDTREDLVNGSLRETAWLRARSQVEAELWAAVRRQSLDDPAFASAWNGVLGQPAIDAAASLDQLKADPRLSALVDVDAILAQQGSRAAFLAEVQRQFDLVTVALAVESASARARLVQLSAACPVKTEVTCTPEQRAAAAAAAAAQQKEVDAVAAAGKLLGGLGRIADPATGEKMEKVVTAWFSIITGIIKYGEAVAGRNTADAIFSGAALILTGDVLGAVMTMVSLMGGGSPSLDQKILDQIVKLRQEVRALHQEMRASFERIETQINTIFAVMLHEFDRLNATLAGNTVALTNIQNQLAVQGLRLEAVAATILTAIGNVDLLPARSHVNQYIGYQETYNQPIPTYEDYQRPENAFHLAATSVATDVPFVVSPSDAGNPTVDPTVVLDTHGESASLSYLARLAQFRDPRVPPFSDPFANPSVWNFGAQAHSLLALQNPAYAERVNAGRTAEIVDEGQRILAIASSFSRPANPPPPTAPPPADHPTNPIFTSLVADYRSALIRLADRLKHIRNSEVLVRKEPMANPPSAPFVTVGKTYNLFGPPNQVLPDSTLPAEPATVKSCAPMPVNVLLARPANTAFKLLTPELRFAHYAFFPHLNDAPLPQVDHCFDAQFVDHRYTYGIFTDTYARLRLTLRTRFRWSSGDLWRDARTASYTWPETRISHLCASNLCSPSANSFASVHQELGQRYPSGKALFEQSATIAVDNGLATYARAQMQAFLHGRQRALYAKAYADVHDADKVMNVAGLDLGEAARLLQAYTRLGFPVALSGDEILSSALFGRYPLLVNKPADPRLDTTFGTAFNQYACSPSVEIDRPCFNAGVWSFQPLRLQPHLETYLAGITVNAPVLCAVSTVGIAGLPGDPVGDCIVGSATRNLSALAARYRHHSELLASGAYQEQLPWVASTVETLPLVDAIVRAQSSN